MTQFVYYHTLDNTIAEMELSREDFTQEAVDSNIAEANEFGNAHGFYIIGIWNRQWNDSKWDHEYARLERFGYFTAERSAELFDTAQIGRIY